MSFDEKTPPHTAFDGFRFAWLQPPFVSDADNAACCHCDTGWRAIWGSTVGNGRRSASVSGCAPQSRLATGQTRAGALSAQCQRSRFWQHFAITAAKSGWFDLQLSGGTPLASTPLYCTIGSKEEEWRINNLQSLTNHIQQNGGEVMFDILPDLNHPQTCEQSFTAERIGWVFGHERRWVRLLCRLLCVRKTNSHHLLRNASGCLSVYWCFGSGWV